MTRKMGLPKDLAMGTEIHGERVSSRFSRGKNVKKKYSTLTERAYRRRRSYVLLRSMIALLIVILALLAGLLIYETRKMKTYSNPYAKALIMTVRSLCSRLRRTSERTTSSRRLSTPMSRRRAVASRIRSTRSRMYSFTRWLSTMQRHLIRMQPQPGTIRS